MEALKQQRICKRYGCRQPVSEKSGKGFCIGHYMRFWRNGEAGPAELRRKRAPGAPPIPCTSCGEPARSRELCNACYKASRKSAPIQPHAAVYVICRPKPLPVAQPIPILPEQEDDEPAPEGHPMRAHFQPLPPGPQVVAWSHICRFCGWEAPADPFGALMTLHLEEHCD